MTMYRHRRAGMSVPTAGTGASTMRMTRKHCARSSSRLRVIVIAMDSGPSMYPQSEPIEPLPCDENELLAMVDARAEVFIAAYGSNCCPECRTVVGFAEPWAICTGCGWIEGY